MKLSRREATVRRHQRVRAIVSGTAERPRVCIFRSNKHVYGQLIDDQQGKTLMSVSSLSKEAPNKNHCNCVTAQAIGKQMGEKMKQLGVSRVVFDRGGYVYHGVIKAFAEGVRSADPENHFFF